MAEDRYGLIAEVATEIAEELSLDEEQCQKLTELFTRFADVILNQAELAAEGQAHQIAADEVERSRS